MWFSRWRQRVRGCLSGGSIGWLYQGWFIDSKPRTEKQLSLRLKMHCHSFISLNCVTSEQYARTVVGCEASVCSRPCPAKKERKISILLSSHYPEISGFLGYVLRIWNISKTTFEFISISNTPVHLLISCIGCLTPGHQDWPKGVPSFPQPSAYSVWLTPCRDWTNKAQTPSLTYTV